MFTMEKLFSKYLVIALLLITSGMLITSATAVSDDAGVHPEIASMPFSFSENPGKYPDEVKYFIETPTHVILFTDSGMTVLGEDGENEDGSLNFTPVGVTVWGSDENASVKGGDELEAYSNYLIGDNPEQWKTGVPTYGSILYEDLLSGVDLLYSGHEGLIKSEFFVEPGSDPAEIVLRYSGIDGIKISDDGSLLITAPFGVMHEAPPFSYQNIDGEKKEVESKFVILSDDSVGFEIGEYDTSEQLIIDPYLEYCTYLGGSYDDQAHDIVVDSSGNAYICGYTASCNFTVTDPPKIDMSIPSLTYNGTHCQGSRDAFVSKISYTTGGNATLDFSTYLGGSSDDFGRGIAVDQFNNMYVCGDTYSTDFPIILPWSLGGSLAGQNDAFVTKIRSDGQYIWYSTYIGGEGADQANDIALDNLMAAFITGETAGNSPYKKTEENYPVTSGAYQTTPNPDSLMGDAFATKLSPTGNSLEYSTYISGESNDAGNGIAVDASGYAYIIGSTNSANILPSGVPGYQQTIQGGGDAFLFKMNFAGGSPVSYATYLGGSTGWDYGEAVAVDTGGCAYITGSTASTDFPTENAYQSQKGYPYDAFEKDAFVTKFGAGGDSLEYSTYLGGSSDDYGYGIAVDTNDRPYVTGYTNSYSFPRQNAIKFTNNGNQDIFVTCFKSDMRYLEYSTNYGGYYDDVGKSIAVDSSGAAYVTGYTNSASVYQCPNCTSVFPVVNWMSAGDGENLTGSYDAFISKLGHSSLVVDFTANQTQGNSPFCVQFTDTSTVNTEPMLRVWDFGDGNTSQCSDPSVACSPIHTYYDYGLYTVYLTIFAVDGSAYEQKVDYIRVCNPNLTCNFTVNGHAMTEEPVNLSWKTAYTFNGYVYNGTATSWQWNFGDGTGNQTEQNPSHSYEQPGFYNVTLTIDGPCANSTTQRTNYVNVFAPPEVEFTNTTQRIGICKGQTVSFVDLSEVSALHSAPVSWLWNFGDGYTSTLQNVTHTYNEAGNFTVSLSVSNPAGSSSETKAEYVSVGGNVLAGFSYSPVSDISVGDQIQFTDASTQNPVSWLWQFGDSVTSTLQNPTHTYSQAGTYQVNLTAWNPCGSNVHSENITVNGTLIANFTVNLTGYATGTTQVHGIDPLTVYFGNLTLGGLADQMWWDFGDGSATVTDTRLPAEDNSFMNRTHTYDLAESTDWQNFTPILTVYNQTWDVTATKTGTALVGVTQPLIADFTADDTTPVTGQSVQFTDTSQGGPVRWSWDFGDAGTSTLQNPTHSYAAAGDYTVSLRIYNPYDDDTLETKLNYIHVTAAGDAATVQVLPSNITAVSGADCYRTISIYLDKADNGLDSYQINLQLSGTSATGFRDAEYPGPSWLDEFTYATSPATPPYTGINVSGMVTTSPGMPAGSTNIWLGNVTIVGTVTESGTVDVLPSSTAYYGSNSMTLSQQNANLSVYQLTPLPSYSLAPCDTDHNGLVDDFDRNGVINTQDVIIFFNQQTAGNIPAAEAAPYDYNGNGVVDIDDVVEFFHMYWS